MEGVVMIRNTGWPGRPHGRGIRMIVTITPGVEGKRIVEYKGIVFGEVISGVDFIKDFASLSDFFGGRSRSYEGEFLRAREEALEEMKHRAAAIGANNSMLMVAASGTAVVIE